MNLRVLAAVAGLLGGVCWVARWGADLAGSDPGWSDGAYLAGLALLGLALAGVGAGLVSRSAMWLRVIVAIAFPLLVWSVYAVVKGDGDAITLDGGIGVAAILAALLGLLTARRARAAGRHHHRSHGSHAA